MWILSFNIHHDASITLIKDDEIVLHLEEERLSHIKNDKFPLQSLYLVKEYTNVIDHCCFTHLWDYNTDPSVYVKYIGNMCGIEVLNYSVASPHHHLHALCAYKHSNFDDATIVVIDGAGADYDYGKENETIFEIKKGSGLKILQQSIFGFPGDKIKSKENKPIPDYVNKNKIIGSGMIYSAVTEWLGWGSLECGKTMGLAPYGMDDKNIKTMLSKSGGLIDVCGVISYHNIEDVGVILKGYDYIEASGTHWCSDDIKILSGYADYGDEELEKRRRNLAYKIQNEYEDYLINLCKKALSLSNSKNLILSGGCALNCVANYKLLKSLPEDINLFVEPLSGDCGVSLGAAFELSEKVNPNSKLKYDNIYLGQNLTYDYVLLNNEFEYETTPEYVANLLVGGNIVAIAQGRSEVGPRALGNRSILFDPRVSNGKDIVNRVKRREYFRPFAGTVLFEYTHEWFDMDRLEESPYMMYAVNVLPEQQEKIPSITHVDGTCRIQTLKREHNKNYYDLISEFYKLTGVPILFNTSFNLAGDTMVENINDAFKTMRNSEIEYMYLPEINKLIYIPNEKSIC